MRFTKHKLLFVTCMIGLLSICTVTWAVTSQSMTMTIKPAESKLDGGQPIVMSPLAYENADGNPVHAINKDGRPNKLVGLEVTEIKFGSGTLLNRARFFLTVENKQDGTIAKGKWWIRVSLYYPVTDSERDETTLAIGNKNGELDYCNPLPNASAYFNKTKANTVISPDLSGISDITTVYLIASYMNPAGNNSPGQQSDIEDLRFHTMVRF